MQVIQIQDVSNQTVAVQLSGQSCTLNIYTLLSGLFCDVYTNGNLIIAGVVCEDRNRIVRDLYLGFVGDLSFIDTQGANDPSYPGLGSRYLLCYLDTFDLAPGEG